ncbi:TPA: radical SAM protein [Candidatus Poribacteria bacterium]|nr:radical SAM protein [Candidatus Poribacteria bacterium]
MFIPWYQKLHDSNELQNRIDRAYELLRECRLCPRKCGVNRLEGEVGVCGLGKDAMVSSFAPHFGEESPLVGRHGSGTIFMTNCNLKCVFCQNYDISHLGHGSTVTLEEFAGMMLTLQRHGCHNINIVTPTHIVPQMLSALQIAATNGLRVPLVYNCGGYESLETLKILDGVVDIYMPDFKYADPEVGQLLSKAKDYPSVAKAALKEMHRQVGDLVWDDDGIAQRGLLVRHLVLPNGLAGTPEVMQFLAEEISKSTYVNVMAQYRPCYRAHEFPEINRRPTRQEYQDAVQAALDAGLTRLDDRVRTRRLLIF